MKMIKEASPLRRLFLAVGALSFVAGVGLLAYGGISALGDDGDNRPEHAIIDLTPTPSPTEVPDTEPATATPVPTPPLGDRPYTMIIDKLGVDAPVETFGLDEQAIPEVPTDDNSDNPAGIVAWYEFSARPGVGSNAVFAGHVTWNGAAVFYNLTSMAPGDDIKLKADDGTELTYKVTEVFRVDPRDPESLNVMKATSEDIITIITCDGAFTDTNDPVFGGDYAERLVVRAALQGVSPAAAVSG